MTRLGEFLLGSAAEKRARQTVRQLESKPKLTGSQQKTLAGSRDISRRLFLRQAGLATVGVLSATGTGVLAELARREKPPEVYHGVLPQLQGKDLISDEEFKQITDALAESSFPLFRKIAVDVTKLHKAKTNPSGLPEWLNEDSSPLPITREGSSTSYAVTYIDWDNNPPVTPYFFTQVGTDRRYAGLDFKSCSIGIRLGFRDRDERNDPIVKAFLLAKEYISLMTSLRMSLEWGKINESRQYDNIIDSKGRPIVDRTTLEKIAPAVLLTNLGSKTEPHRIVDALPVLLLGAAVMDLANHDELPRDIRSLGHFGEANNLLIRDSQKDTGVFNGIVNIIDSWVRQDSLLPPPGITESLISEPLLGAIQQTAKEMGI